MNFGMLLRVWLVAPAIIALVTWMWAWAFLAPRSPLLMAVVIVSFACGLVELVAATVAISRLILAPTVRSPANVICTAIGTIPALLFVAWYRRALY